MALLCVVGAITVYSEDVKSTIEERSEHSEEEGWTVLEPADNKTVTLSSGNYYLDGPIRILFQYQIPSGAVVNLCLNGKDITCGTSAGIKVLAGGELNIYDCQEKCGAVIRDNATPIMTNGNGKITLYNGSIERNEGTTSSDYCISLNSGDAIVYKDKGADDKNQATVTVLLITPFIAAAAGVIVFKKRKA